MYWRLLGREADQDGINTYAKAASERGWEFVYTDLKNSAEGQRDWDRRNPTRVSTLEAQASQLASVRAELDALKSRPPEVVIKEVEKIVEKIVEVPTGGIDPETKATIQETNSIVKFIKTLLERIFK
jgi:predicted transcriptional regulator